MGLIKVVNDYDQPDLVPFCKPHLHCTSGCEKQGVALFHLSHPGSEEKRRHLHVRLALGHGNDKES